MLDCCPEEDDEETEAWEQSSLKEKYSRTQQVVYRGLGSAIFLGCFGTTSLQVAIKVQMKRAFDSDAEIRAYKNELAIHSAIPPHPNVIRLLAAEETTAAFLLVTPYTPCGDLWELTRYGQAYCEVEVRNCAAQMFHGLHHIHTTCDLIHGDIKPHNFLLALRGNKHILQVCDFGLAAHPDTADGKFTFRGLRGTSGWFAPEQLQSRDYSCAVDIFNCGVILFRMLGGYKPFDPPNTFTELEFDDRYWCHVSDLCRDFLRQVICIDPVYRLSAKGASDHEWIKGPAPPEPTVEQLKALSEFGPPPVDDILFWAVSEMPDQARYDFTPNERTVEKNIGDVCC